jgi:cell division protein ZapA
MSSGHSEKPSVRVSIFNQSYNLRTAGDPAEVEELARSVDALMDSIASKSGTGDTSRVAVLACLHLADRLRAIERELESLKKRVDEKTERFSMLLEQVLEGDDSH